MSITGNVVSKMNVSVTAAGKTVSSSLSAAASDTAQDVNATVPAGTVNAAIDLAFKIANIKQMAIVPTVDMTLKTNSTSSPGDTLALKAGVGVVWGPELVHPNPFTVDVTKIYVSNAGVKDGVIAILNAVNLAE